MFKWRRDKYNREMDEAIIHEYPWMHYRPRKGTAIELAKQLKSDTLNKHIYSYKKEISKWESFQVRSKQWLERSIRSLTLEIEHYSKPKNLMFLTKRWLKRISVFPVIFISENISKLVILAASKLSVLSLQFYHFVLDVVHTKELLPSHCSDCGLPFKNRWRHPEQRDKHTICVIIGED